MDIPKGLAMRNFSFLDRIKLQSVLDNMFESVTVALENLEDMVNEVLYGRDRGGNA